MRLFLVRAVFAAVVIGGACLVHRSDVTHLDAEISEVPYQRGAILDVMYADANSAWSHQLVAVGVTGEFAWVLVQAPAGMTLDASTGEMSWTATDPGTHVVTVTLDLEQGPDITESFQLEVRDYSHCVWFGHTGDEWENPANWDFCSGGVPGPEDWVSIPEAGVLPVVRVSTAIPGFADSHYGSGVIELAGNVTLTLTATQEIFQSSVGFQGYSANCDTCRVHAEEAVEVVNDATLTLLSGVVFEVPDHRHVWIGTGSEAGHLVTEAIAPEDPSTWPVFEGYDANLGEEHWNGVRLLGTRTAPARVSINGLRVIYMMDHDLNGGSLHLAGNFVLEQLDHFAVHRWRSNDGGRGVFVDDCATGVLGDIAWEDLVVDLADNNTINVSLPCDPGQDISITGEGETYGDAWEDDPFDRVTWR